MTMEVPVAVPRWPYDLVFVCIVVAVAFVLSPLSPREPALWVIAFLAVYFAPGYALASALFPGRSPMLVGSLLVKRGPSNLPEVSFLERLALAVGMSLATGAVFGILLTRVVFQLDPITVGVELLLLTLAGSAVALRRRSKLPPESQFTFVLRFGRSASKLTTAEKGVALVVAASLLLAGIFALGVLGTVDNSSKFTEFYITGTDGSVSSIPSVLSVNESGAVFITIVNKMEVSVDYNLTFGILNGAAFDAYHQHSWASTEELEVGIGFCAHLSLRAGETLTHSLHFLVGSPGDYRIDFTLDDGTEVRELWILVDVVSAG